MKPRKIKTYSILAVAALGAATGCAKAAQPKMPGLETSAPALAPTTPVGSPAVAAAPAVAMPEAPQVAVAQDAPAEQPAAAPVEEATFTTTAPTPAEVRDQAALAALRTELARVGRVRALWHAARYTPLCDAQGFPLVGNM